MENGQLRWWKDGSRSWIGLRFDLVRIGSCSKTKSSFWTTPLNLQTNCCHWCDSCSTLNDTFFSKDVISATVANVKSLNWDSIHFVVVFWTLKRCQKGLNTQNVITTSLTNTVTLLYLNQWQKSFVIVSWEKYLLFRTSLDLGWPRRSGEPWGSASHQVGCIMTSIHPRSTSCSSRGLEDSTPCPFPNARNGRNESIVWSLRRTLCSHWDMKEARSKERSWVLEMFNEMCLLEEWITRRQKLDLLSLQSHICSIKSSDYFNLKKNKLEETQNKVKQKRRNNR